MCSEEKSVTNRLMHVASRLKFGTNQRCVSRGRTVSMYAGMDGDCRWVENQCVSFQFRLLSYAWCLFLSFVDDEITFVTDPTGWFCCMFVSR